MASLASALVAGLALQQLYVLVSYSSAAHEDGEDGEDEASAMNE